MAPNGEESRQFNERTKEDIMASQVVWIDMPVVDLDPIKRGIGPYGFRAILPDSEGNRIVLHSM